MEQKQLYIQEALSHIPHLLEILDRSPVSKTYGCFDREYWHYKAKDFSSGLYEECVLPLALVYTHNFPGNIYFNNSRIREYVIAAIDFARRSSHANGSTDDYYPNEEALGATAFSLYACTEAYLLLGLHESDIEEFFKKRARFIAHKNESGILSNHHALAAVALYNVYLITKDQEFKQHAERKIEEVLGYQSPEGWFQEYEGCDPGYLTFTIDFLAKYLEKDPDRTELKTALEKAVRFCFLTVHPDGTYGGEYGSRNTTHFIPNGFEMLASSFPEAAHIRNLFLKSLEEKICSRIDDDRIFHLYIYNYIQAFLNHNVSLTAKERPEAYEHYFKDAGLFVRNKNGLFFICSIKKGGVFKLFRNDSLTISDCGLILEDRSGKKIISQVWQKDPEYSLTEDSLRIKTCFFRYSQILPSPLKQLVFRTITLGLGRRFSRITRTILQKILIVSKKPSPATLERKISFGLEGLSVIDTITDKNANFAKIYIPTDFSAIYVASSKAYTSSTLMLWADYSEKSETLNKTGELTLIRKFS